jgi:tetratricopeptide (TPR) repeat protein
MIRAADQVRRYGTRLAGMALAAAIALLVTQVALPRAAAAGLPPLGCIQPPAWVSPQAPPPDSGRPPEVLSWRHQILEQAAYEDLAQQWEAFATDHPHDPWALVEWGDALRYAGRYDEGVERYARAFAVDSSNAAAAAAYCFQYIHSEQDQVWRLAHQHLLQAASGDPQCTDVYYALWATSLRSGDEALTAECLRRLVALGDMPQPLLEWGRNMIAGAPPGAVILTNGDNDTYPPLAYQAITGDRPDVAIVNLSLLNTSWYIRHWRDRGALITLTDEEIGALQPRRDAKVADQVQRHMVANCHREVGGRPLCYSVTVYESNIATDAPLVLEGLLRRVVTTGVPSGEARGEVGHVDLERTRELIDTVYQLDGALDPFVDWKREQAVGNLCLNYSALLGQVGAWLLETRRAGEAGPYLYRAVEIMAAHGGTNKCGDLMDAWKQADSHSALLVRARGLADAR